MSYPRGELSGGKYPRVHQGGTVWGGNVLQSREYRLDVSARELSSVDLPVLSRY